jgi:predicted Holliday junction resolvase-like endonuclease
MKVGLVQTILAVLSLVLVVVNIMLALGNQSLQAEVNERQQFIAQSIQLEQLNRQVVAVLANMAMKSNDEQLKNLLASSGVGIGPNPESAGESK